MSAGHKKLIGVGALLFLAVLCAPALHAAIRRAYLKYSAMREAMESSVGEQTSDLFRRIEPLNVIGNIGPLLGLLGTVLGMIMAFYKLLETGGTPKTTDLAGGIGTA